MSGSQGRFPPPMPPQGARHPLADGQQQGGLPHQTQPGWPPVVPQAAQQAPVFPPRFGQEQAAAASPAGYVEAAQQPTLQQTWSPAPPATFPPAAPQPGARQGSTPANLLGSPPQAGYGYAQQAAIEPPRRAPEPRMPDPASYDLGSYGLPTTQQPIPTVTTGRDPRTAPSHAQPQQWPPHSQPIAQQPLADAYGYPAQHSAPQSQPANVRPQIVYPAAASQQQQSAEQDHAYEEEVEVEPAPKKRRHWVMAGALVGSIAIGSGMAYGYKMLTAPKVADGKGQVVKASREPAKVAPANPGGKQFANTDSRVLNNRVPSEGSAAASGGDAGSSGFTNSSGVRVVQTIPVGPGAAPAAGAVPGMMVVGPNSGSALPPSMAAPPPLPAANPPAAQPQRVAAAPPPPAVQQPATPRAPAARPTAPAPEAEAPARTAAVAAPKPPATERPKAVSGYVAVLGFQKSQLEAMKMMADLQQKYEALRDKRLEIVQSDQSARGLGTIYRIVVGPRGGITPVRDLCNSLQQAGMPKQGCYPLGE